MRSHRPKSELWAGLPSGGSGGNVFPNFSSVEGAQSPPGACGPFLSQHFLSASMLTSPTHPGRLPPFQEGPGIVLGAPGSHLCPISVSLTF